jgi:bisphosphoglycerate-independent phosphoglycerate mutase (AlkP superfamily)
MKMIFIFIDGFGIGANDKEKNPLVISKIPCFDYLFENSYVIPTDACLGVPGLPQSATGQTTIFTGVNASRVLGRHLHGQPTFSLKRIINQNNLFKELIARGLKVTNANVYREEYIAKIIDPEERRFRPSVTTVMSLSAGIDLRTVEDYKSGNGIYHDITGKVLKDGGYVDKTILPQEAAERLYKISRAYDFTLFEYFMTDVIGHKSDMNLAVEAIELLDRFIGKLIELVDLNEDIIYITSDHGNIEDVSVKTHTLNKVPTIIIDKLPENADIRIESLADIMPSILKMFDKG